MAVQRITLPLFISLAGIMLFLSWYLPVDHGWWALPDHAVFRFSIPRSPVIIHWLYLLRLLTTGHLIWQHSC